MRGAEREVGVYGAGNGNAGSPTASCSHRDGATNRTRWRFVFNEFLVTGDWQAVTGIYM